jgi:hypothetical protein
LIRRGLDTGKALRDDYCRESSQYGGFLAKTWFFVPSQVHDTQQARTAAIGFCNKDR